MNLKKISFYNRLDNKKNLIRLKYLFKYFQFKKSLKLKKIKHNKIFLLKASKKLIFRKYSKEKSNNIINLVGKKNLNLYKSFISFIFKAGKKYVWEKVIKNIFLLLKKNLKFSQNIILLKIFLRLYSKIEIKKIKSRKKTILVPVFISIRRRFFLSLKWLLVGVNKNKLKISLKEKLFIEIFKIVKNKSCDSLKQLELNNKNVYLNRSNFHYRW
jgi:ribosomal protein S7